jgi:cyclophilin family peptidyl-prolyl cis-trans isomerase
LRHHRRNPDQRPDLFDALESRLALYTSPLLADLPDPAAMASTQNTVVRLRTSEGNIDIELYDQAGPSGASAAPITTANFLEYIRLGRYESTFFHRLLEGFVLQGGGFAFTPPSSSQQILLEDPIQNEFDPGRSNVERTIAMAKVGGDPNSATSQFFFNLGDNSGNLNNQNGGFTVFGKVIGGWDIVQTIEGFEDRDLDQFFTGTNSGGLYDNVPLSGPNNTDLVLIVDAEILKPGGQTEFFTTNLFYPEGYRSARITTNVDILNEDVNGEVGYQIIARFENGSRDKVIAAGTLQPGAQISVPISRGGDPGINNVRPNVPFAYEIRATGAVAATMHHKDFGATASESFIDPHPFSEGDLRSWSFADGIVGPGIPAFLTWQSVSLEDATLTITFTTDTGQTFSIDKTVNAFRRGGLNLNELTGLPSGLFSVNITSTQPIVAALSQYRASPGRASTETGVMNGGAAAGVLPAASIPADGQSLISLFYPGASTAPVTVTLTFVLSSGAELDGGDHIFSASDRRRDFDLQALNGALPVDQYFTIRYSVAGGSERIAAGYTSITAGDTLRTPFQTVSTQNIYFAGGAYDPGNPSTEVISLFNPFQSNNVTYRLRFHFTDAPGDDSFFPADGDGTITAGARVDISVADLEEVIAKITSGAQFRRYSISVETTTVTSGTPITGAVFGQLTRTNAAGDTVTYGPNYNREQGPLPANDPIFG